jgi:hypothetical protein
VAPWTLRNYLTYGALIVVDTTGAENLWLDNDPAGREAVKAQLYALGDDMAARQRLATRRGAEAILADPGRFLGKAWGEAQRFFALQFFDDMRERRAIWMPPHEVWLRLALGDGGWLLTLLLGVVGLWLAPERWTGDGGRWTVDRRPLGSRGVPTLHAEGFSRFSDPRWLLVPWALYVVLTGLIFHVELRYRLPLYPALLPYAGWALARSADCRLQIADWAALQRLVRRRPWRIAGAGITVFACFALMLLHRPYIAESWMLARKHAALWRADRALAVSDLPAATGAAQTALALDGDSALARVALARAAIAGGDLPVARQWLDEAVAAVPDHPRAHMLRGAVLRELGNLDAARRDLAYETATLEDAQRWAWGVFAPLATAPGALDVGGGLDLGYLRGFHPTEQGGFRWTDAEAEVRLALSRGPATRLELRLASGRPPGAAAPTVTVLVNSREVSVLQPSPAWQSYPIPLPDGSGTPDDIIVTLRSDTYRPRDFDRTSPDNRVLGVMVDAIGLVAP